MANLRRYSAIVAVFCFCMFTMQAQYQLRILPVDRDSAFIAGLKLQTSFRNNFLADEYVQALPALLQSKGYIAASVDSVHADSTFTAISLYIGDSFKWAYLNTGN